MSEIKLKPCPVCGGEAKFVVISKVIRFMNVILDILLQFNAQDAIQDYRANTEFILDYQTEEI